MGDLEGNYIKPSKVLTLAYPKNILFNLPINTKLFVADLGIPKQVYHQFNAKHLPFNKSSTLEIKAY